MKSSRNIWLAVFALVLVSMCAPVFAADEISISGREIGHVFINVTNDNQLLTDDAADGIGTQLGQYKLLAREMTDPSTGAVSQGAYIIMAANGDTISGTYSGTVTFSSEGLSWVAYGTVNGGTGRFQGATGSITLKGIANYSGCQVVGALDTCQFTEDTNATIVLPR